jgi:hypothetical protein
MARVTTVHLKSGSGGGLLVIATTTIDRMSPSAIVVVNAQQYQAQRGNTTTPQTSVSSRVGPTSWTETFTTAITGTARDLIYPQRDWALEVKGTGAAATAWDVRLEVSLDNATWTEILAHATADGDSVIKWQADRLAYYMRVRVVAPLTLGAATNIIVLVSSMP